MSQLLALEWNGHEARAAVASQRGRRIVIEQAFVIPLNTAPPQTGQPAPDIGGQIAEALGARGIGQLDVLVAVGRGSVELRQLQLPPATDEELPRMVRLQALMEFNELDEKWLLDFIPVDESIKGGPRAVLAAAIAPKLSEHIEQICHQSGLTTRRLTLRSCEAAALLARTNTTQPGAIQLLVELFTDQADLTVTAGGRVIFLRTMHLGSDPNRCQNLAAEIRLTMAAVQNQCGCKVWGIVLCGRGEADAALAKQIESDTKSPTTLLDPFAGLELGAELAASLPKQPGRFAAVLGMLLTEFDRAQHAIDFLHPRRALERVAPQNKWKMAAIAAGLLLAAYLVYGRLAYSRLESEVNQLAARAAAADQLLSRGGNEKIAAADEIAKWTDSEIVWLDHLREFSEDFPPTANSKLGRLTLTISPASGGGEMQLEGWAKNTEAIAAMEHNLRAHGRRVIGIKSHEDRSVAPYSWQFNTSVVVGRKKKP